MGAGRDARRDTQEMRLLLVEDNARLSALMVAGLSKAGFATDAFTMAVEAEAAIHSVAYSAMILDLGLPDHDGLSLLKKLRAAGVSLPILILTARGGIEDGYAASTPGQTITSSSHFAQEELYARIRVVLRRPGSLLGEPLELGTLQLDTLSRQVTLGGPAALSPSTRGFGS